MSNIRSFILYILTRILALRRLLCRRNSSLSASAFVALRLKCHHRLTSYYM